jgi:SAM-dependent methyltransferase
MTWSELDWNSLGRHRERFLGGGPPSGPYWTSPADLAGYDLTYGERIGWKWDAVLDELVMRGWTPPQGSVLDWGCGSGSAGRRVVARFGREALGSLMVWDHSPLATAFAQEKASKEFPGMPIAAATPEFLVGNEPISLLVVSHVLNELAPSDLADVRALVARSFAVIWVEPGSHDISRSLGLLRDEWTRDFRLVAPCTHANACPILAPGNERHWCHHFASPPSAIFADSNWVKFGQRAGIDLRSLPYSFIALDRDWDCGEPGLSRVIGRPEHFKPYVRLLNCDAGGLEQLLVMKRHNAALYKELDKTRRPLVYRWTRDGAQIMAGTATGGLAAGNAP